MTTSSSAPSRDRARAQERAALEMVKTVALATGVRVPGDVLARLGGQGALTVHEYPTTGGITLVMPQEVLVNAAFDESFCDSSALSLEDSDGRLELRLGDLAVEVLEVLPLPGYLDALDPSGRMVSEVAMSHADRVRLSPIDGCAYNCGFCDLPGHYARRPIDQILAALDVALRDELLPVRHVLISGGSPGHSERDQRYFLNVCVAVIRHAREVSRGRAAQLTVDIMMSARKDGPAFVERLVAEGVDGFSLNVEAYSEAAAHAHLPRKHKLARPYLRDMLESAVQGLGRGSGRVRSLIIPGLETTEQTLEGVEWLASLGCHPVLSPFRPARGTALAGAPCVSVDALGHVLHESREIVSRHGVTLGPRCVRCQHNTLSFPWDIAPGHRL